MHPHLRRPQRRAVGGPIGSSVASARSAKAAAPALGLVAPACSTKKGVCGVRSAAAGAGRPAALTAGCASPAAALEHLSQVSKNGLFEPFIYQNDRFTKTGSGQT
jgi:hypothetical protein